MKTDMPKHGTQAYKKFRKNLVKEVKESELSLALIAKAKNMPATTLRLWCSTDMSPRVFAAVSKRVTPGRGRPQGSRNVKTASKLKDQMVMDFGTASRTPYVKQANPKLLTKNTDVVRVFLDKKGQLKDVTSPGRFKVEVYREQ